MKYLRKEKNILHMENGFNTGGTPVAAPFTNRAGVFMRQPHGYTAFIPASLPPNPPIYVDIEMLDLLSKADRALGRLDGSTEALPNPELFVYMYVRKEAVLSSQIEGTQASLIDVLEFESQTLEPHNPQDIAEVVNYVSAMDYGFMRLKTLPISLRLIKEIHERLMQGVRGSERSPGEFRTTQNWIGSPGCNLSTATFVPPPPHEMKQSLADLETFIHSEGPMPILIKVGLAHAQLETIHPFLDGNGRMGRLLITFLLCQGGTLNRPLLYLSYYFKRHRAEYYDRLQAIRISGHWEEWIKFFLRGVYEVAQEATLTARKIVNMREQHRTLITERLGRRAAGALSLLERLYIRPFVTVGAVEQITGLSTPNANTLTKQLEDLGILRELTGNKRYRRFGYMTYLDLFKDSEVDTPNLDE